MNETPLFRVRFWGVRGSYPTPGPHTIRYGGNTTCVEVEVGGQTLILDAGSGIIRLGEELVRRADGARLDVALFLTHGHGDHLIGLPFFGPLYESSTRMTFLGPRLDGRDIQDLVTPLVSPPYFPVDIRRLPSQRRFHTLTGTEQILWHADAHEALIEDAQTGGSDEDVRVLVHMASCHPQNGAAVYRIEHAGRKMVFATDVEWHEDCDEDFLAFIEGADLLIHDSQYTPEEYRGSKQGFGHSTFVKATEVANEARVGKLVLFHHEPMHDDDQLDTMQAEARTHFAQTYAAYEGLEFDL